MPTTYYVRKTGSDANAGTSAGAAWLTIGKALGAAGIASGDTVYIGAGVYREVVSVAMTSATAETFVIGDVDGAQTGDAGEVIWTAYTTNDKTAPSASATLSLLGRDFLTFTGLTIIGGDATATCVLATTSTSINISFIRCSFFMGRNGNIFNTNVAANVVANWILDSCIFLGSGSNPALFFSFATSTTADWDTNIQVKNCTFLSVGTCISLNSSGANSFKGGGVDIFNCIAIGGARFVNAADANVASTAPNQNFVYNCFLYQQTVAALIATTSGQIVEDYNIIYSATTRTNVTAGTHSIVSGASVVLPYSMRIEVGQSSFVGSTLRPFGELASDSPMFGFGAQAGGPSTDILGLTRPSGDILFASSGTATAGAAKTLTDSGKTWGTNSFAGYVVKITGGTGSGQTKHIASNTATVLTVDGNWKTNPSTDSTYVIYTGATSSSGTATAGTTTSLTDSNAAWGVNQWTGYTLEIDSGTGSPQSLLVTSNTATVLSFATATAPDATSTYKLYRGTNENTVNYAVGCYERGDTAVKDTGTVRTGPNSIRIAGPGVQDFNMDVNASLTNVRVWVQWDGNYSGTKPQMFALANGENGVTLQTATAVGSSGSWELLSVSFTPTSAGIITIRLQSNSTTPTGMTYFDDFYVV